MMMVVVVMMVVMVTVMVMVVMMTPLVTLMGNGQSPLAQRPNMGFKVVSFEWGNISTNKKYLLNCRSCLQNLRGEHIENVISLILLLLFLSFYVCGFFQTRCILSLFPSYNVGCSPLG